MSRRLAFLEMASVSSSEECLLWPFAVRQSSGYGAHSRRSAGRQWNVDAHVEACTLAHGPRPSPSHQAAHSCGDKLCCNGRHLRWATPDENMADAKAHGTLRGGGRYRQRLFKTDVAMIRDSDLSLVDLGRRLEMEPAYLGHVRRQARREAAIA